MSKLNVASFDPIEWFSAVVLSHACMTMNPPPNSGINDEDMLETAIDLLESLINIAEGGAPSLSERSQIVISVLHAHEEKELGNLQ